MDRACVTPRSGAVEHVESLHPDREAGSGPKLPAGGPGAGPRTRLGSLAAPLAFREFRLLFLGQAVSLVGSGAAPVALSFALLQATGSVAVIGYALTAQIVPVLAFLLIGGVWADRLPRQRVMLCSDVVRFGVQAALGTLLVTGHLQLVTLLSLQAIKGIAEAFFTPASGGLVPLTVGSEHLQQANALRGIAQSAGSLGGPVLGGVLVATIGAGWALQVDGATYLVSAFFLAAMHPAAQDCAQRAAGALRDLRDGWRAIRERSWLSVVIVQNMIFMTFAVAPTFVLGPLAARAGFGGAEAWGLILGSMGVGELLGGLGALTLRPSRALLSGCVLTPLYGLFLALLTTQTALVGVCVAATGAGFAVAYFDAVWCTAMQMHVPDSVLSRVASFDAFGSLAGLPLGFMLAPLLSRLLGLDGALLVCAAMTAATAVFAAGASSVRRLGGATTAGGGAVSCGHGHEVAAPSEPA